MSVYNVYLAQDGTILREEAEGAVFSRSNCVNKIRVWDKFENAAGLIHRLNMTRSDGEKPTSVYLTFIGEVADPEDAKAPYAVFEHTLTAYQLGTSGLLTCSVDVYAAGANPTNEDPILTTAEFAVTVARTVSDKGQEVPADTDMYQAQLEELTALFQQSVLARGAGTVAIPISEEMWKPSGTRYTCEIAQSSSNVDVVCHGLERPTFVGMTNKGDVSVVVHVAVKDYGSDHGGKTVVLTADDPLVGTLYLCNTYVKGVTVDVKEEE